MVKYTNLYEYDKAIHKRHKLPTSKREARFELFEAAAQVVAASTHRSHNAQYDLPEHSEVMEHLIRCFTVDAHMNLVSTVPLTQIKLNEDVPRGFDPEAAETAIYEAFGNGRFFHRIGGGETISNYVQGFVSVRAICRTIGLNAQTILSEGQ